MDCHTGHDPDNHDHACCAPSRGPSGTGGDAPAEAATAPSAAADSASTDGMARLGGSFLMGTEDADGFPQDREGPIREVDLPPFWIDKLAVTNARWEEFAATGYRTEAEQAGWTFVFAGLLPDARVTIYPDSAHGFLFQHHTRFAPDVHAFLDEAA